MNNPMTTAPSPAQSEQQTRQPAYNGLFLVSRSGRPVAESVSATAKRGLTLASERTVASASSPEVLEARSAESIRMKLAACFGALLTAPVVWCLHTLLLSH